VSGVVGDVDVGAFAMKLHSIVTEVELCELILKNPN